MGGTTWQTRLSRLPNFSRIKALDDNTFYAFGTAAYLSTDAGVNWTSTGTFATSTSIEDITISAANFSYGVANYAGAYKSKSSVIPPIAPTALSILANGHNTVALEWTDNSNNEVSFRIEASMNDNAHYDSAGSATRDDFYTRQQAFSYVSPLTPGKKYFFRVKAVGPGGFSTATNEVSVTLRQIARRRQTYRPIEAGRRRL
ncbi:MAG: fibronectin type III domain-containing protein [Bacteroidota bacterium]